MTEFAFRTQQGQVSPERKAVLEFLNAVDPEDLSRAVLDVVGWGTGGDPVVIAIQILKDTAESQL